MIAGLILFNKSSAQTLGGNAVFNFLNQPNTAQLSALGGVNVSNISNDVGMVFQNPALLSSDMHLQANASFHSFIGGIRNYSATSAWHLEKTGVNLAAGTNYFDYGSIAQTDAAGNISGSFRPVDYVVQVMASKDYREKFRLGSSFKYVHSGYGQYRSAALALDLGVLYYDTDNQLQLSLVARNIGTQLVSYEGAGREELPFDLVAGITKRLADAPFQFSLTAHHLQQFNIYYNDTSFRASEGEYGYAASNTLQKIFSHIVLSTQVFLNEKLELTAGYNFMRRQDLNAYNVTSGLNGFSMGAGLLLNKVHIRYATGFYQTNMFHQLSININWKGSLLQAGGN
ncbi:MAG: hypothetical protein RLZZ28_1465 [Bacteroidota bacterium]|jgi:hypothetical protein